MTRPGGGAEQAEAHPHTHADVSGGWLRAAVFGAMDGLVTNTALVAGVSGGGASAHAVVLSGVAGLVAGAISMALGEYTSVSTQNEQLDLEVAKERHELATNPVGEQQELAELWEARGLDAPLARAVAEQLSRDPEQALRVHAVSELGLDPDEKPSPMTAAVSSFLLFAVGAVIPLLPFLLGAPVLWLALLCGGVGLVAAGVLSAQFTPRPWWSAALRQLLFGAVAAGATYLIGLAIGVGAA
ncbi:Predicted Fe2+/Mn2+ transporter, VIT1/CCC1 family [Modestobacter sp. DSM 44400]|uniref:VIT1/CCC1 transporter family protein n=1 Tax=Modestobacter sp. DSM 44400 TaxID=1550230 RepID=UPI0008969C83|nr:VIT1/CCC1 transporter family protein [Modestobacter sp. DSM 44400]SDY64498.1 Predicted Fe2+/Mn2+ transporter, VIT1/CCC1 family [Modestobacter sp. DSM 44400]